MFVMEMLSYTLLPHIVHRGIHISPHSGRGLVSVVGKYRLASSGNIPAIFAAGFGRLFTPVSTFSILSNVKSPSMILPNTTCLPVQRVARSGRNEELGGGTASIGIRISSRGWCASCTDLVSFSIWPRVSLEAGKPVVSF